MDLKCDEKERRGKLNAFGEQLLKKAWKPWLLVAFVLEMIYNIKIVSEIIQLGITWEQIVAATASAPFRLQYPFTRLQMKPTMMINTMHSK